MPFRTLQTTFANPDDFVDAFDDDPRSDPSNEYPADEYACLDDNDCENDGGHLYLTQGDVTRCVHCWKVVA